MFPVLRKMRFRTAFGVLKAWKTPKLDAAAVECLTWVGLIAINSLVRLLGVSFVSGWVIQKAIYMRRAAGPVVMLSCVSMGRPNQSVDRI